MPIGVLNADQVRRDIIQADRPALKCDHQIEKAPEASSIDAPLGDCYYEMPGSCRPGVDYDIVDIIRKLGARRKELEPDTILRRGHTYLIPLGWDIALPRNICVRGTAKSSIGRLDALVRLVADKQPEFDRIGVGGSCKAYVEVVPLTFDLVVRPGQALFRIPSHLAVECQAYSEGMGDIRIHYAGFAHPWFGYERAEGTPLIFEVRGHSVDTFLRHGDALAKVYFRRMSEPAAQPKESSYNKQELNLSACFSAWA